MALRVNHFAPSHPVNICCFGSFAIFEFEIGIYGYMQCFLCVFQTAQDSTANVVRRRKSPSPRPERPKSEISVRWADLEESREITPVKRRESSRRSKQRPKSDLGMILIGHNE